MTTPISHKLLQKAEEEEVIPKSLYKASVTLIFKSDKDKIKTKIAALSRDYRYKIPHQNISKTKQNKNQESRPRRNS